MEIKNKDILFPQFCDYSCKFAGFAGKEVIGDCRKELAVWCKHFEKYNYKNSKCIAGKKSVAEVNRQ